MPLPALRWRPVQTDVKKVCTDCVCSGVPCAPCSLAACAAWILRRNTPRFVIARRPQADVAISGRQLRFRRKCPIIRPSTARFPRRFAPRNGNSDSLAPPNHHCNTRNCRRRSLSAATDAIGWYVLIGSLQTASAFPRLPRPLWGLAMTHQGSARCTAPPRNDTSDKSAA